MSNFPFGFGLPDDPDDNRRGEGGSGGQGGSGEGSTSGGPASGGSGSGGSGAGGSGSGSGSGESGGGSGPVGPGGPFGFGMGGGMNPNDPNNPLAGLFGSMNPNDLGQAFQQLGKMLSYEGGPVNWELAKDIARQTVAAGTPDGTKDASVGAAERSAVTEALRLADLWLDGVTSLPAAGGSYVAWSRAEWVEDTLASWKQLVDPVAEQVGTAMGQVVPEEMQAMAGPLLGMMRSMGGAMFGSQIGQALGTLAGEVVGSTDVGLPLAKDGRAALLPLNVAAFGKGLNVPEEEVRLYLALREAAHQRLFAHVPWLRAHLFGAVEGYARGIKVDTEKLEGMVGNLDPSQPEAMQEALQQGMFQPEDTPEQKAALARLETALALVEGWVDAIVHEAAKSRLSSADALRETLRRRRATGGPAEQTFATLIGLELRPRRLRDASRLWASLADARGADGRDALWSHPDMLPTPADLDDPDGFVHREELVGDIDFSELDRMLQKGADGGASEASKDEAPEDAPEDGDENGKDGGAGK